jgi:hypothetical protein
MNVRAPHRQTPEIERTAHEGLSLDDVLSVAQDEREEEAARTRRVSAPPGVVVATVTGIDESGCPWVSFPAGAGGSATAARTTVALGARDVGRDVVVMFEGGDAAKPIVIGMIQPIQPLPSTAEPDRVTNLPAGETKLDGQRVVLAAHQEIVLCCGDASITLTRAGKVLIRGAYVLSRSSGVNRIKGGSVQIN